MKVLFAILIFCIVLFFYLHIVFHLKKNNDLEVLYVDENLSKERLEELCDLRLPTYFNYSNELNNTKLNEFLNSYGNYELETCNNKIIMKQFLQNDNIISYNNQELIKETNIKRRIEDDDTFLRPDYVASREYDMIIGKKNTNTILKYEICYRNYLQIIEGQTTVILIPPRYHKYLHVIKDYDDFEFKSEINPWNIDEKYIKDYNKVKTVEVKLNPGDVLYIPAYWFYSLSVDSDNLFAIKYNYKTYMNSLTVLNHNILQLLQKHNIKHRIINKNEKNKIENNKEEKIEINNAV
jgi:hypothetical protein